MLRSPAMYIKGNWCHNSSSRERIVGTQLWKTRGYRVASSCLPIEFAPGVTRLDGNTTRASFVYLHCPDRVHAKSTHQFILIHSTSSCRHEVTSKNSKGNEAERKKGGTQKKIPGKLILYTAPRGTCDGRQNGTVNEEQKTANCYWWSSISIDR